MNMVRVWGGGIYEKKTFYDLCDKMGLLVWQDFMFACSMYPGNKAFLENVEQEAIDNIKRLRNHPSIVMWCGNNECLSAWKRWGWRENVIEEQGQAIADTLWQAYVDVYHKILPEMVKEHDNRFYWSSSPSVSMGVPEETYAGDIHYWGVWWGKEPFETYETVMPRFMSEFGFQSFPEFSTVKKYTVPGDHDIYSEVMKSHQRSSIGNETIEEYMLRDYKKPKDFQSYLYVSHVLQAEGIGFGLEAQRRNRHRCMGTLYWQLNDCWPVASWSSRDYYGQWKALHYFTKKAFRPILVSPRAKKDIIQVYIVSDKLKAIPAKAKMTLMDFSGNTLWEKSGEVNIAPNQSLVYYLLNKQEVLGNAPENKVLLLARVMDKNGGSLSENILYFKKPKDLALDKQPGVNTEIEEIEGGFALRLSADKLAKNLYLSTGDGEGFFSDNYFDVLPGHPVEITYQTGKTREELTKKLNMVSLVDTYE
jgi:beta-mannosidase